MYISALLALLPVVYFSDSEGQSTCTACPAGYYCVENSTDFTQQVCPMGYYCPNGTTDPYANPCPKGTYNPVVQSDGVEDCLDCPPGQYCAGMWYREVKMEGNIK